MAESKLDVKSGLKLATQLEGENGPPEDGILEGLNERQQVVLRLRLRGMTIRAIANGLKVAPAIIQKEINRIKDIKGEQLTAKTTREHAAEAVSLYEEVEQNALQIYTETPGDKNLQLRALSTALQARDRHVKLLMDLGFLQKASSKSDVNVTVGVLQQWEPLTKRILADKIIEAQLEPLADPIPLLEAAGQIPVVEEKVEMAPPLKKLDKMEEYDLVETEDGDEEDEDSEEEGR